MSNLVYLLGGLLSVVGLLIGNVNPRANGIVLIMIGVAQLWSWR